MQKHPLAAGWLKKFSRCQAAEPRCSRSMLLVLLACLPVTAAQLAPVAPSAASTLQHQRKLVSSNLVPPIDAPPPSPSPPPRNFKTDAEMKHEAEIESDPLRASLSHAEILKDSLDRDHRPLWLSKFMFMTGVTDLVDSSLCYLLNWACPTPPAFVDSEYGQVYFWCLVCANLFVIMLVVSVLGGALSICFDRMPRTLRTRRAELARTPVTVLLPCFLPNEHEIMDDTIHHIIHELEYEYPFVLIVCYNTPRPHPKEEELAWRDGTLFPNGRRLHMMRVDASRSKAENLNAALEHVATENVIIYDADHHPDPQSLLIATAAMEAHGVECIQGSTYLRSRPNLLAQYINAEFFVTHFVWFPAMQYATAPLLFAATAPAGRPRTLLPCAPPA